jgi:hypothetical protein
MLVNGSMPGASSGGRKTACLRELISEFMVALSGGAHELVLCQYPITTIRVMYYIMLEERCSAA